MGLGGQRDLFRCHHSDQRFGKAHATVQDGLKRWVCKEPRGDCRSEPDQRRWGLNEHGWRGGGGQDPPWAKLTPGFNGVLGPILGVTAIRAGAGVSKEGCSPLGLGDAVLSTMASCGLEEHSG